MACATEALSFEACRGMETANLDTHLTECRALALAQIRSIIPDGEHCRATDFIVTRNH